MAMMEPVEGAEGRREGMKHTRQVFGPSVEQRRICCVSVLNALHTKNGLKHLSIIKGPRRIDQLRSY